MAHDVDLPNSDLRQCTEFEYILIGDLRDLLEEPDGFETRLWLVAVLDALVETLPRELQLKSESGYLADVLDEFPNWENHVQQLQEEHVRLHRRLVELRDRIRNHQAMNNLMEQVRVDLETWMEAFVNRHREERRLVQTAANLEVGCGD